MLNKYMVTLLGLAAVILAMVTMNSGTVTKEGFWNTGQRAWKTFPVKINPKTGMETAVRGNYVKPYLNNDQFIKTPNFQAILSPRFSNVNYGANIRYNMPDYANQGSPCNPLTFSEMAQENYDPLNNSNRQSNISNGRMNASGGARENYSSCAAAGQTGGSNPSKCGKAGLPQSLNMASEYPLPSSFASGNYGQMTDKLFQESNYPLVSDTLPVGTMATVDADGNVTQPVVYDRFVFASSKSRLRNLGDQIRGDLPIVPCQQEMQWFGVYPNINIDLNQGAMNVMGGVTNDVARETANLINSASGGATSTIGGMDLAGVNMTPQYNIRGSAAFGDVNVTGYP